MVKSYFESVRGLYSFEHYGGIQIVIDGGVVGRPLAIGLLLHSNHGDRMGTEDDTGPIFAGYVDWLFDKSVQQGIQSHFVGKGYALNFDKIVSLYKNPYDNEPNKYVVLFGVPGGHVVPEEYSGDVYRVYKQYLEMRDRK